VRAEIAQGNARKVLVVDQPRRRTRQQDLPAVSDGADAGRTMHADPDVATLPPVRLRGMEPHADP
jgi:hypothetical protein